MAVVNLRSYIEGHGVLDDEEHVEAWFVYGIDLHHIDEKKILFPPEGPLCPCGQTRDHQHRWFGPRFPIRP